MGNILFLLGMVGMILMILVLLLTEYRVEVKPATAMVYNNRWTGCANTFLPGTHFMVPGIHQRLEEVTLRNEARNPSNVMLFTGDGIEMEVDYIIRRQQIGYPSTDPVLRARFAWDPRLLRERAVMAATAIDYKSRNDLIQTRIVAALQMALEARAFEELFPGSNLGAGVVGKIDKYKKDELEAEVNAELARDPVTQEWGFAIEVDIEDYDLPEKLRKVRETRVSAEMEGAALKSKMDALGVADPETKRWLLIADAASDAIGRAFGGKKTDKK